MALPPTIRVNARVPFPPLVTGSGFIFVVKQNGTWTIAPNYTQLAPLLLTGDLPASLVAIYDPATKQFNTVTAAQIAALASTVGARTQRSITGAGSLPILGSDSILNFNNAGDLTPTLPLASTRNGAPITINNKPGSHTQTVGVTGADTIDGVTSVTIAAGQRWTFWPYSDGVNVGYFID